jgi:hypothetical protein
MFVPVNAGCMGFFDALPAVEPELPHPHHPWDPPDADFPGIVPIDTSLVLGRTDQVAVAITALAAYPTGFEIFVTARMRSDDPGTGAPDGPDLGAARRSFHLGLQLSDGTKVIGLVGGGRRREYDSEPTGPILRPFMGGGGPHSQFSRWWAWPLPPKGPLDFVCAWTPLGIPETRVSIDAELILDAADRTIRLWPENED